MSKDYQKIIIIGAGGFGREVYRWLLDIQASGADIEIEGFYDPDPNALDAFADVKPRIIGADECAGLPTGRLYVCAIGNVAIRAKIFKKIKAKGGKFFTVIHPTVRVSSSSTIGEGSILCPQAIISEHVNIGANVIINFNAVCGHDVKIGDHCNICPLVNINGRAVIKEGVFIGSSAVITERIIIPENCQVAAASVVYASSEPRPNSLIHGNPARFSPRMDKNNR
jgi:sugar O-acyltransferase (sialic acid O-acetyltransferase NeuD family)